MLLEVRGERDDLPVQVPFELVDREVTGHGVARTVVARHIETGVPRVPGTAPGMVEEPGAERGKLGRLEFEVPVVARARAHEAHEDSRIARLQGRHVEDTVRVGERQLPTVPDVVPGLTVQHERVGMSGDKGQGKSTGDKERQVLAPDGERRRAKSACGHLLWFPSALCRR